MTPNKAYKITKLIKLHTKPLQTALVIQKGIFKKENKKTLIFDTFWCRKSVVVDVEEIERSDTE